MPTRRIERIPISEIRIVNPRSRSQKTFRGIITNIESVGLKKPITAFRREAAQDGTRYDLVCGQGRLEALAALGATEVPALLIDASLKDRYLMGLVENVARKRPRLTDLLREVRRLKEAGHRNSEIAQRLGMGHSYVDGIVHLLKCGEDRLVEQVEAGTVPLSVAVKIATSDGANVQRALSDAYDTGELRGHKLYLVQRIIAQRAEKGRDSIPAPQMATKDLAKEYERHTLKQRELVVRARVVWERIALLTAAVKSLLADEEFAALLTRQGLGAMPMPLATRLSAKGV
jgi:ParB family chromosome partitioning protein